MERPVTGRFAPTPSGRMHLGNLFCSLLAWLAAKKEGGRVVLRMEDLDQLRTSSVYAEQAEADLKFLGLFWDEGGSLGGPHAPYDQGSRSPYYQELLGRLEALGLVYPCFCSRAELHAANAPHASDGEVVYAGTCRGLTREEIVEKSRKRPPALRLKVPAEKVAFVDGHYGLVEQDLAAECGDFILRRSDGVFAYQLAVVVDDGLMGINQVVRGSDLLTSTPRQIFLQRLLGYSTPEYCHVPLLCAPDGRRLSKREADLTLDSLRASGVRPEEIVGRLACCAGLMDRPEPISARELIPLFDLSKLPREDIPFEW